MQTSYRPISKRRLAELRGYVAWSTSLFRAALLFGVVGLLAWALRTAHVRLGRPLADSELVWLVPSAALAIALYWIAGRWTGGRAFRAAVREDLAGGVAAVHDVRVVDAIEVEEGEDEGPAYFVLTDDGKTLLFAGQYLAPYRRKGFPWKEFEILEAPRSKIFFGLLPRGERLAPSVRRPPFTWEEFKAFARDKREYGFIDVDFSVLKERSSRVAT